MQTSHIRNFSIIAHIDHGKSTLADRMLEITGTVSQREAQDQLLDTMELERERGITIKASAVTMRHEYEGQAYMLNLIDTPGHVDFHYEVSRALAACEGALLVVDATQGVEAQTVANAYLAVETGAEILGVINKVDLPASQPDVVGEEIEHVLGIRYHECFQISAKTGTGVKELLDAVCELLPAPQDNSQGKTQALIFDSHSDEYQGVICYVRVMSGSLKVKQRITLMGAQKDYLITELGKFSPAMAPLDQLGTGEVGYLIANIRTLADVTVGDTITDAADPADAPLKGYEPPMQMVFSDFYPGNNTEYPKLRAAFDKLALNDASFSFVPQNSPALSLRLPRPTAHGDHSGAARARECDRCGPDRPQCQLRSGQDGWVRPTDRLTEPATRPLTHRRTARTLCAFGDHHGDRHDRWHHETGGGTALQAHQDRLPEQQPGHDGIQGPLGGNRLRLL